MASISFSFTQPIREGWRLFKKYWKAVYAYFGVMLVYQLILSMLQGGLEQFDPTLAVVFSLLVTIVFFVPSLVLQLFGVKLELEVVDETYVSIARVFEWVKQNWKMFWQFFVASIVVALVVVVPILLMVGVVTLLGGFDVAWLALLLALPMVVFIVYVSVRLQFYRFLIVDRDLKAVDSVKESWRMAQGKVGWLIVFGLVLVFFNLAGMLLLLVGLLVTAPVSMLATVWVYRQLAGGGQTGSMGSGGVSEKSVGESPRWHHGSRTPAHQPGDESASPQPVDQNQQGVGQPSPQMGGGAVSGEGSPDVQAPVEPQQDPGNNGDGDGGHPVYG